MVENKDINWVEKQNTASGFVMMREKETATKYGE